MIDLAKAGVKTSEFLHAASVAIAGFFAICASLYEFISAIHSTFPQAAWASAALAVMGGIMAVGASLGYSKSRAVVKAADAQVQVANIEAGNTVVPAQTVPANPQ